MYITWSLHEFTKEADQITEVGSSDREVDKTSNKLPTVCRPKLCGVGVGIQFEVSVEKGVATSLHSVIPNLKTRLRD